jgi:hypothetical protein
LLVAAPRATYAQAPVNSLGAAIPAVQQARSVTRVTAGSTLGWIAGLAAGVALGYAVQPDAGDSFLGATEWWVGGWIGSSIGSALGAHLANGSQGNLPFGMVASFTVVPIAVLVTPIAAPIAQIGISVIVERETASRRRR